MRIGYLKALAGVSALAIQVGVAQAQEAAANKDQEANSDEILVVAQRRTENIQDVPLSITAVSGKSLEARGINSVAELASRVPSLNVTQSNNTRKAQRLDRLSDIFFKGRVRIIIGNLGI